MSPEIAQRFNAGSQCDKLLSPGRDERMGKDAEMKTVLSSLTGLAMGRIFSQR